MKTCTFIGHGQLYDKSIRNQLKIVIKEIIDNNHSIEFIFNEYNNFDKVCKTVMNEIQHKITGKKIILTSISEPPKEHNEYITNFNKDTIKGILDFDRYVSPLSKEQLESFSVYYHQFCWAVEQSDYVISYVYEVLDKDLAKCIKVATNSKARIIDLTNRETESLIALQFEQLCDKDKFILDKRKNGFTLKQIGFELNVTTERARQQEVRAFRRLRKLLFDITNHKIS